MPEIANVERIREKLREFEERVDGAVSAAKTLARVRTDAEKLLTEIQNVSNKSEQSLQKAEVVQAQFQQLQSDWEVLNQKAGEAEERLKATNRASLAEQAELLKRLDVSTKTNADTATKAQSAVSETANRLDGLLAAIREELQSEVRTKLASAEGVIESELQRIEKYLENEQITLRQSVEQKAANHQRTLREETGAFQAEMKRNLTEHQQAIDRQLTDFLNKQNALIQNLSQQIDSYQRVTQAQDAELAATKAKLNELSSTVVEHIDATGNQFSAIAKETTTLKNLLAQIQASLADTVARLDKTVEKLKTSFLIGGKFK